jgi:hypothetical protein
MPTKPLSPYGPGIAALKGKTANSHAAPRATTFTAVLTLAPILAHHRNVTICADFLFVHGLSFVRTISRGTGFLTIGTAVLDRSKTTILREARAAINLNQLRGLTERDIHADNEFECLRDDIHPIALNIVPADGHVGDVERFCAQPRSASAHACIASLPFKHLPRLLSRTCLLTLYNA